ncbi:dihydrodipicolinate synthase family protein [Candidatus Latescibacterota bacterium]
MKEKNTLSGVLPVLQMAYNEDYSIDYDTLKDEIDHVINAGSDGIVLALASELLRLNRSERLELASKLPMMADHRATVTISVGAETSKEAAFYAEAAEKAGANAVMAIPPVATAISAAKKLDYYKTIKEAISIPLVVQDASGYMGGEKLSVDIQARLYNELGPGIYFKPEGLPTGPTISQLQSVLNKKAVIFEGSGGYMLIDSYRRGVSGTMPGSDLIRGIVGIWDALEAGDDDRAYEIYYPLSAIVILQTPSLDAFLAIEKYLLVKQGILKNQLVRQPTAYDLDRHTAAEVDRLYERFVAVLDK